MLIYREKSGSLNTQQHKIMFSPSKRWLSRSSKFLPRSKRIGLPGVTLIEMTIVILVLMSLFGILFFGARAWKRGSDRAVCIIQIQNVQRGVRSYSNLYNLVPGDIVPDLKNQVIGSGKFLENVPICPANGAYSYGRISGSGTIPPIGILYLECSLSGKDEHEPTQCADW